MQAPLQRRGGGQGSPFQGGGSGQGSPFLESSSQSCPRAGVRGRVAGQRGRRAGTGSGLWSSPAVELPHAVKLRGLGPGQDHLPRQLHGGGPPGPQTPLKPLATSADVGQAGARLQGAGPASLGARPESPLAPYEGTGRRECSGAAWASASRLGSFPTCSDQSLEPLAPSCACAVMVTQSSHVALRRADWKRQSSMSDLARVSNPNPGPHPHPEPRTPTPDPSPRPEAGELEVMVS